MFENNFYLTPEPPIIRTMENLLFLLATTFVFRLSSPRRFKKHMIGDSGCSVLLLPVDGSLDRTTTESGDDLFFHDFTEGPATYGFICIQLQQEYALDDAGEMLASYMDKLQVTFFIMHHTGQQTCADWNAANTKSIVDYWQDDHGHDWKV